MGLKKKSKVNAEFNMSSLTDIIFLLLIFFMLTSSLVVPNALNLKLPGKKKTVKVTSKPPTVSIKSNGTYYFSGSRVSLSQLESKVRSEKKRKKDKATIKIAPHPKANTEHVVAVMDMAFRYNITAVLDK